MTTAFSCKLISEQNAQRHWRLRIVNEMNESFAMKSEKNVLISIKKKKYNKTKKESQPHKSIYQHDDFQSCFGQIMNELSPNGKHTEKNIQRYERMET